MDALTEARSRICPAVVGVTTNEIASVSFAGIDPGVHRYVERPCLLQPHPGEKIQSMWIPVGSTSVTVDEAAAIGPAFVISTR